MALNRPEIIKAARKKSEPELRERAKVSADYWLYASDHEKTQEDGTILALYAQKAMTRIRKLEKREKKFEDLVAACRILEEGCQRREEHDVRHMQELAAEARRTGRSQAHRIRQPTVFDVGNAVDAILAALTAVPPTKEDPS